MANKAMTLSLSMPVLTLHRISSVLPERVSSVEAPLILWLDDEDDDEDDDDLDGGDEESDDDEDLDDEDEEEEEDDDMTARKDGPSRVH